MSFFENRASCASDFFLELVRRGVKEGIQIFIFYTLVQIKREEEIVKTFENLSFEEIEEMTENYVKEVTIRPLLSQGGLGGPKEYSWNFPTPPQKVYWIWIADHSDLNDQLETFVHEILHIFFFKELIKYPDENELDLLAKLLLEKHREKIYSLFQRVLQK